MSVDFKMRGFCPHCSSNSIQRYLNHHVYDEEQGGLWDGEPETAKQPASYFIFACNTCEKTLLYHFYPTQDEVEDLLEYVMSDGYKELAIDVDDLLKNLDLVWPELFEDIHKYVPASVRKQYLRALRKVNTPNEFAKELRIGVEIICDACGIERSTGVDLKDRINQLSQVAKLPSTVRDVAHKIRLTGNKVTHQPTDIDPQNVPVLRNFFRVLVNHVFVLPLQKQDWGSFND
jgi:hypothetical protein